MILMSRPSKWMKECGCGMAVASLSIPVSDWSSTMNLLIDPVFQVMRHGGRETVTLPELLARLGRDEVDALPGLQRHQVDTIHIFLCYLAANVLVAQGRD